MNPQAIRSVIDVYVENVRTVIEFETTHFGTVCESASRGCAAVPLLT